MEHRCRQDHGNAPSTWFRFRFRRRGCGCGQGRGVPGRRRPPVVPGAGGRDGRQPAIPPSLPQCHTHATWVWHSWSEVSRRAGIMPAACPGDASPALRPHLPRQPRTSRRAQPRRCHIDVAATTSMSHRRGNRARPDGAGPHRRPPAPGTHSRRATPMPHSCRRRELGRVTGRVAGTGAAVWDSDGPQPPPSRIVGPPTCLPRAEGRVGIRTDERGACDERAPREPKGASMSGLRSEEPATSDEGRHRRKVPGGERGQQCGSC
jgi:hypothetical protein